MRFEIQPYVGAMPVAFGMPRQEVHRLLGLPHSSFRTPNASGVRDHFQQERFNVGYDGADLVNHVGFSPGAVELLIQGRGLWRKGEQADPNPVLLALDPEPVELVGFWAFLQLGVTTAGYHDDDASQRSVAVFPRGTELWAKGKPANTCRYRAS